MAQAKKKGVKGKVSKATKAKKAFVEGEIVELKKIEKPSSMAFIRQTISNNPIPRGTCKS